MSHKPSCIFLDRLSIDCDDLDFGKIKALTDLFILEKCDSDEVVVSAQNAEIIIVNKVILKRQHLEQLEKLKLVCVIATGTNNVDLTAATDSGIIVCNVRNYAAASVSQHVFMLILSLTNRFLQYQQDIKRGVWQSQDQFCLLSHPTEELKNKTLGLIGYGHIAQAVEKIALAFGMKVILAESLDPNRKSRHGRIPLDELLARSDVISLHCPLSERTSNLIGQREFELMKSSAVIINTARGGIINEADLVDALRSGQIAGAGVDCLVQEPPAANDPMMNANLPQLIITPHNAWITLQARQSLVDGTAANIQNYLNSEVNTQVND